MEANTMKPHKGAVWSGTTLFANTLADDNCHEWREKGLSMEAGDGSDQNVVDI